MVFMKLSYNSKFLFYFLTFISISLHSNDTFEHSTVSIVQHFESIENVPKEKYANKQFKQITNTLNKIENKIRIVTYNMLFNIRDDRTEEQNRWPNRLPRIVKLIDEMDPDIISTQELYPEQVQDLCSALKEKYDFFPGKRETFIPGKIEKNGESYGIFYRTNRFNLILSEFIDPLAMVQLEDAKTKKMFTVFNTHMPLANSDLRESLAEKIVSEIEKIALKMPVLFTGDLNTFPNRVEFSKLPSYDGDYIHSILSSGSLKNSYETSMLGHFGPISSFTNNPNSDEIKPFQGTGTPGIILDHIYVTDAVKVLAHGVEQSTVDGHFPSDHMPVFIDFILSD
jgi:endonuclease/exonuclease/phosphatase family metal-dependent hydrolase